MSQKMQESIQPLACRFCVVAVQWLFGISLPRQIDGDDGKVFPQDRHYSSPGVPTLRKASQQDDSRATSALNQMKTQSRRLDLPMVKRHSCQYQLWIIMLMSNGQTRSPSLDNIRGKEDGVASGALDGRSLCEVQYWNPADANGDGSLQQLSVRLAMWPNRV
jgi:hypothetical protein